MVFIDYYVIGGGPAGIALGKFLTKAGFKVKVIESLPRPGMKPCGGGVPPMINDLMPVPKDVILTVTKKITLIHNFKDQVSWEPNKTLFYMIDRSAWLEHHSTDFDVTYKKTAKILGDAVFLDGTRLPKERTVIATGAVWRIGERKRLAKTIQYVVSNIRIDEEEIFFYTFENLVGYAWIFPTSNTTARVGIGSTNLNVEEMETILKKILNEKFSNWKLLRREGAPIDMGGIKLEWATNAVGEAIGAVMPATGEGIRPSIITSKLFVQSIVEGKDYKDLLRKSKIFKVINMQSKLLDIVERAGGLKISKLNSWVPELVYKIGLGEYGIKEILKASLLIPQAAKVLKWLS